MKTLIAIILFFIFNISFSRFRFPPNVTYPGKLELNHQTGDVLCIYPRIDAECYCVFREDPAETYIGEDNNYLYFKAKVEIINEKINFITDATGNRLIAFEKSKIEEGSKREKDFLAADTSRRRNQPGMLFYEPLTGTFWCFCPDPIATCRCIYAPGTPDFVNSFVGEDERGKIYLTVRNGKNFLSFARRYRFCNNFRINNFKN